MISTSLMTKFSIHQNSVMLENGLKGSSLPFRKSLGAHDEDQQISAIVREMGTYLLRAKSCPRQNEF